MARQGPSPSPPQWYEKCGLAPVIVGGLGETLLRLATSGVSIPLIEQNFGLVQRVAERVLRAVEGRGIEAGTLIGLSLDSLKKHVTV